MFPFALLFGAIGAVASVAGAVVSAQGSAQAAQASKEQEKLRAQQVELESERQRRQVIRNGLKARSLALTNATADGAQFGSGFAGGTSQIANKTAENTLGINQAESISKGIFANQGKIADAESLAAFGQGMSSFGSTISGINFQ